MTSVCTIRRIAGNWVKRSVAIRRALLAKSRGRVLQTDRPPDLNNPPNDVDAEDWKAFAKRVTVERLFFDYLILSARGSRTKP